MKNIIPDFVKKPLKELPFAILDIETTGFYPNQAGLTEIALISIHNGKEERFETMIDPEYPVPAEITRLTGITQEMVNGQPKIAEVLPIIDGLLQDSIFVAHNVPFDWSFLDFYFKLHLKKSMRMPSLCTLRLARKYLNLQKNNLECVASHFNISLTNAHRAMNDTVAVRDILFKLFDRLEKEGIKTGEDLYKHSLIFPEQPPTR
ncbi:MAG: 3'-5' exonuclease [Candidatus Riflebacteria bacterium]